MSKRAGSSTVDFWGDTDEEEALQRYRTLLDTLDDGIYQLDDKGYFVAVNDRIVGATDYGRRELLGSHVSLVSNEILFSLCPEGAF